MTFQAFNLDPRVVAGIPRNFDLPTPIQAQAIPAVLQGKDLIGLAQTGTGKTAAFVLPILHRLASSKQKKPRALVIAPTRELVEQICEAVRMFGVRTGLTTATIYGGVSMNGQEQSLRKGADIVVACPGRLLDHLNHRTIDLRALEVLVLDEADQMFDMGFLPDIRKILKSLPTARQTLLFSATMPQDIRRLAQEILRDPTTIEIGQRVPVKTVAHAIYPVEQNLKSDLLLALLKNSDTSSVLIFTRTKHRAKRLGMTLERSGYRAAALHGNLSQNKRQTVLDRFREGKIQILVATDIAARGIDVDRVSHVVNFDMPDTVDAYTHRIGRTGRAERSGDAYTLVTHEDKAMVRSIERILGVPIERRYVENFVKAANSTNEREQQPARREVDNRGVGQAGRPHRVRRSRIGDQPSRRESNPPREFRRNHPAAEGRARGL